VIYENSNGIPVRAKLLKPVDATEENPCRGFVHIHGYQNNRETGTPSALSLHEGFCRPQHRRDRRATRAYPMIEGLHIRQDLWRLTSLKSSISRLCES